MNLPSRCHSSSDSSQDTSIYQLSPPRILLARPFSDDFTIKDLTDYLYIRINEYINYDLTEEALAESFTEYFIQFSLADWQSV